MTTKEKILAVVRMLPDDISIDDAINRLHLLQKIEEGLQQAQRGEGVEHERLMSELLADNEASKIFWTPRAQQDLTEIYKFIAADSQVAGRRFVAKLKKEVDRLKTMPQMGAAVSEIGHPNIREFLLGNYRIIYLESATRVDILTVFHAARLLSRDNIDDRPES